MSQQYGFPPPPPTPSHGFFPQRQRAAVQPPSITTAVARVSSTQSQTPSSGTSSLSTPFPFSPHTSSFPQQGSSTPVSPRPPSMASQPYNPRQWSQRGQSSGSQMVFQRNMQPSTRDATGMEGRQSFLYTYSVRLSNSAPDRDLSVISCIRRVERSCIGL